MISLNLGSVEGFRKMHSLNCCVIERWLMSRFFLMNQRHVNRAFYFIVNGWLVYYSQCHVELNNSYVWTNYITLTLKRIWKPMKAKTCELCKCAIQLYVCVCYICSFVQHFSSKNWIFYVTFRQVRLEMNNKLLLLLIFC